MGSTSRVISNIVIFHPSFTNCVFAEEFAYEKKRFEEEVLKFFFIPTTKKSINQLSNFDFPRK